MRGSDKLKFCFRRAAHLARAAAAATGRRGAARQPGVARHS